MDNVIVNGKLVPFLDAKISVFDSAFLSGYGIYETLLVDCGEVFDLEEHVERLFDSAKLLGLKLPWSQKEVCDWVFELVRDAGPGQVLRVRITVSFGSSDAYSPVEFGPQIVICAAPFKKKPTRVGYNVVTYEIERIMPMAKTTCLLPQYLARTYMAQKKADEVLLVNRRGEITEGSVTNVFFVRDSVLVTPKDGILIGTMRGRILSVARELGVKVRERSCKVTEEFDECFVTNSLIGVVPVLSVDGRKISGKIGLLTKKIQDYVCKKS